jgi:hypothetical protein
MVARICCIHSYLRFILYKIPIDVFKILTFLLPTLPVLLAESPFVLAIASISKLALPLYVSILKKIPGKRPQTG